MNIAPVRGINNFNFKAAGVQQSENKNAPKKSLPFNPASATGWITAGAIATAGVSGLAHKPKLHTVSAIVAMVSGLAHIGVVSAHHAKHHPKEINA